MLKGLAASFGIGVSPINKELSAMLRRGDIADWEHDLLSGADESADKTRAFLRLQERSAVFSDLEMRVELGWITKLERDALNSIPSPAARAEEIKAFTARRNGELAQVAGMIGKAAAKKRKRDMKFADKPKGRKGKRKAFTNGERETIKAHLGKKQKGKCNGCRRKLPMDLYEIDHIHPVAKGGGNELSNLQLLCPPCNRSKGAK